MASLDELRNRVQDERKKINESIEKNEKSAQELERVGHIADQAGEIISDIDRKFAEVTKLDKTDILFLFLATGLQCARIFLLNKFLERENAGNKNKLEKMLHDLQEKIMQNFDIGENIPPAPYYAPKKQIITTTGVPYDATRFESEKLPIFKGANHRFSTLGHDPVLGFVFGTANIMTNTITCINKPIVTTNMVNYTPDYKNPKIGPYGSTMVMFGAIAARLEKEEDYEVLVASIIKQAIHIATDLFTTCGIQLPGANLLLSKENVELLTKYISTGDLIKAGISGVMSVIINAIISTVHHLLYDETKYPSRDIYDVKTRKIILYSNTIATSCNLIWATGKNVAKVVSGVPVKIEDVIHDIDLGGLIVTVHRLVTDTKFIREVKYQFIENHWEQIVKGEEEILIKEKN